GSTNNTHVYGSYERLLTAGTTGYTYDNNGNMKTQTTGSTTSSYTYDSENRLTKVTQGSSTLGAYAYNPRGQRVEKIENGVTTVYENQGVNVLWERPSNGPVSDYVYASGLPIARVSGGSIFYFHADRLGSTRLVTQ